MVPSFNQEELRESYMGHFVIFDNLGEMTGIVAMDIYRNLTAGSER
jgi:hypothetical protein